MSAITIACGSIDRNEADSSDSDGTNSINGGGTKHVCKHICNICLNCAEEPVVTMCGHLFCSPCLSQWLKTNSRRKCPVCKAKIGKKIITVCGRENIKRKDLREKYPPLSPTRTSLSIINSSQDPNSSDSEEASTSTKTELTVSTVHEEFNHDSSEDRFR